ncbi:MAG: hypothetical protein HC934_13170 [Acaryochloridaceae cyanobacterium SU_2_1]|nr:hypothetical protein [Acaryochloridaceae cyanobacterium SU_2_1]
MNALSEPKIETQRPLKQRRKSVSRNRRHQRISSSFAGRFAEASLVLGVNLSLIGVCLYTLSQLFPHQLTQQAKLRSLESEVQQKIETIEELQKSYAQSLDPELSRRIAEEQSHLIPQTKRNLVWVKKNSHPAQ